MIPENALRFVSDEPDAEDAIYTPLKIISEVAEAGSTIFTITNMTQQIVDDVGVYLEPTSNLGPWDNPADSPPATDYQDLLTWGSWSKHHQDAFVDDPGISFLVGGLRVRQLPDGEYTYFTRAAGSQWGNRIKIGSTIADPNDPDENLLNAINSDSSLKLEIKFEVPGGDPEYEVVDSRRLFISVAVG